MSLTFTSVFVGTGSGEPPLVMSSSALFAIKHAAEAARAEIGQDVFFSLSQWQKLYIL